MINRDRLAETFETLVKIDSISRHEKAVAEKIAAMAEKMGAVVVVDGSQEKTGSSTGNLVLKFKGNQEAAPLLLSAHMDTVTPGEGITPIFEGGRFTSDGTTILGADDKSAIAIILESLKVIQEKGLPCGPVEVVLSTCEEIGLQGAKNFDFNLISAKYGYAVDTSDTGWVVNQAPAANRLEFKIHGKDAHAGVAPEQGINAISLAAKAMAGLKIGRIDSETTCNIGMIQGGIATNIVPNLVHVKGEVRSHNEEKLEKVTAGIVEAFEQAIESARKTEGKNGLPRLEVSVENDFPLFSVPKNHQAVTLARAAARNLGRNLELKSSGGGSDANIFFAHGIMVCVLGTGMQDMHTVRESILLDDMADTAELIIEIINLHSTRTEG